MKTAPITYTEMVVIGGACVFGFVVWRASQKVSDTFASVPKIGDAIVTAPSDLVLWMEENNKAATKTALQNLAEKYPDNRTPAQNWVADTVQKGQDAGAGTFVTSFFTGLFK